MQKVKLDEGAADVGRLTISWQGCLQEDPPLAQVLADNPLHVMGKLTQFSNTGAPTRCFYFSYDWWGVTTMARPENTESSVTDVTEEGKTSQIEKGQKQGYENKIIF